MTDEKKKLESITGTLTIWDGNDITDDGCGCEAGHRSGKARILVVPE